MDFETRLAAELAGNQTFAKSLTGRRATRILSLPDGNARRKRALKRMEGDANTLLERSGGDWSKSAVGALDWAKVLELLVKLLPLILMLFGI